MNRHIGQRVGTRVATATLALIGMTALTTVVKAATYNYDGIGNWTTSGDNWGGDAASIYWNSTAGATNTAVFDTAGTPTVPVGTVFAKKITFAQTANLSGGSISVPFSTGGTTQITANANAQIGGEVVIGQGYVNGNGLITATAGKLTLGVIKRVGAGSITFRGAGDITVTDGLNGWSGSTDCEMKGTGTLTLNGNVRSYKDLRVYNGATVCIGSTQALGYGSIYFDLVKGSATLQATTDLSGVNKIANAITIYNWWDGPSFLTVSGNHSIEFGADLGGALLSRTITNSLPAGKELIFNRIAISWNSGDLTLAGPGDTRVKGVISDGTGSHKMYFNGTGTTTLHGTNTYTGTSSINAGRTLVDGVHTNGGTYTVASGATLGGKGSIKPNISVAAGGTLAAGGADGLGALNVKNVTLASGATNRVRAVSAAVGAYSQIRSTEGTIAIAGARLSLDDSTMVGAGEIPIIKVDDTATRTGTFNGLPEGSKIAGVKGTWLLSYSGGDGNDVSLTLPPSGTVILIK
jgi:autotransporter-associated beta strand protein